METNRVIQVDGKPHIKAQVHLLPTHSRSSIVYNNIEKGLFYGGGLDEKGILADKRAGNCTNQHLYFTTDEEIKEGDWFLLNNDHPEGRIRKCHYIVNNGIHDQLMIDAKEDKGWGFCKREEVRKIVATTDESLKIKVQHDSDGFLNIPFSKPSPEFIKVYIDAYNAGNPIEEVLIQIDMYLPDTDGDFGTPITDKNNHITIKKVKDSYSREEILRDIEQSIIEGLTLGQYRDKWI